MFDKSILGHSEIRQKMLDRVRANRLNGCLLFAGPDAVGKRRVAVELAMREICLKKSACGVCEGCKPYKADPLHVELPNLLRIAPEGAAGIIKVDALRGNGLVDGGVIQWAHQAPPPGCHRWVIIEDAHRLGDDAANMLLKTLEEPPLDTIFLLVSHRPGSVLPTILSRCERVAFSPLNESDVREIAIRHDWDESRLGEWMALAGGTLRYLDEKMFDRACSQLVAWLSIIGGTPFKDVSKYLLPIKSADLAQGQQVAQALEQLLLVLGEYTRAINGQPVRLACMSLLGEKYIKLTDREINIQSAYKYALEALRALPRNVAPETILRKISLAIS